MTIEPTHPITPAAPSLSGRIASLAKQAKTFATAYRVPILIAAALLFIGGLALSVSRLDISLADLSLQYIALSAAVFVPIAFLYGALNFMVMARGAGVDVRFAAAFKISCVAQFAEFLPVPGGAIVRGGALISHGSGAASATGHVLVNALLWVACAALAAGLVLGIANPIALVIALSGLAGIGACTAWLWTKAGSTIALAALAMRFVGLIIAGARIFAAFLAIGVSIGFFELYPFVFATILGSAAAIAPGGLGISEVVAAAIATLSTVPPEAAFIAVALNRLIGFAVSGFATGIISLFFSAKGQGTNG